MPLNPQYVQKVSEQIVPGWKPGQTLKKPLFENISSQMADPGSLPRFFGQQNSAHLMPFTMGDIPQPREPILQQLSENNNVSALPKTETLTRDFDNASKAKEVRFRTQGMRMWNVPLGLTELRATDAMY